MDISKKGIFPKIKISKNKKSRRPKESLTFKVVIISTIISIVISSILGMTFGFLAGNSNFKNFLGLNKEAEKEIETDETGIVVDTRNLTLAQEDAAVVKAVENSSPAVVSIIVTKDIPRLDGFFFDPFSNDPFFNPFGSGDDNANRGETEKQEIGGGTGFIVDREGYIITNKHVVSDEDAEYTVMLNEEEKLSAKVLAKDDFMDVAILKIETDKKYLPTLKFGNSDNLKIGQTVIAIGNSLGEFRNTVSKGIISGLKRNVDASDGFGQSETLEQVIQTDAAINPGNSGGPLINLSGQVIGINVAMAQGAENIGFSLPINQIKEVYQSVKETGKISRPFLGVRYLVLNKTIAAENKLPFDYGALVVRGQRISDLAVIPGSPADKAGLQENDIILEIDGKKVNEGNDIAKIIRTKKVGDSVKLKVWSKGKERTVDVVLEESNQ